MSSSPLIAFAPKNVMKTFTVRAVTWKTRLSNSIWTWRPIAPAATGWPATSYGGGESAFALLLFQRLRTLALQGTELANATAATIRQRLLKIGALVRVSTRRVYVRLASAFPLQKLFAQVHRALAGLVAEDG